AGCAGRSGRAAVEVLDVLLLPITILVREKGLAGDVIDTDAHASVEEKTALLDLLRSEGEIRRPFEVNVDRLSRIDESEAREGILVDGAELDEAVRSIDAEARRIGDVEMHNHVGRRHAPVIAHTRVDAVHLSDRGIVTVAGRNGPAH